MDKNITYSDINTDIDEKIKKKKVIPYSIFPGDKFRKGKWYYSRFFNDFFKVLEVEYAEDGRLEEAYIISDKNRYSLITTDLCTDDLILEKDSKNIYKSDIFNTNIPYTGAEIRYWFFIHDIDCFNQKYGNFWKYVDRYSEYCLDDRKKYRCYGNQDIEGNLINCRVKEYNITLVAAREQASKDYKEKDIKFLKHDIERNKKLMKKRKHPRD